MKQITATFTVFFEVPFWKGIYERQEYNKVSVALVVFGAEPKDFEVAQFLTEHFKTLLFSSTLITEQKPKVIKNYKRLQRNIKKQTNQNGIGTKSQQILQQQRELLKTENKKNKKQQKKKLQQQQFEMKQQKKKQKKKGH
ncbi:YjdF family protein [Lachnospiraceae bacterium 46-61]